MAAPSEITVLTLNCWGLKYISALRTERLAEIGRRLAALADPPEDADPRSGSSTPPLSIVALQECWVYDDFATIHRLTAQSLPYAKFFRAGVWGAGLAVLSRWPIVQSSMYAYALNGRPTAFWRGDWFVGKGIGSVVVEVGGSGSGSGSGSAQAGASSAAPASLTLEILVTHTHAPYESGKPPPGNSYLVHQLSQTWEMGKRIAAASERGHLVLAMGDFNMTPLSEQYKMLIAGGTQGASDSSSRDSPIHDVWRTLHPNSSLGPSNNPAEKERQLRLQQQQQQASPGPASPPSPAIPGAAFNMSENGATSDNVYNTWRWPKDRRKRLHREYQKGDGEKKSLDEFAVAPDTPDPRGKRLDYIFYKSPTRSAWHPRAARVAMVEPHSKLGCSVSDHFAVLATLASGDSEVPDRRDTVGGTVGGTVGDHAALYDEALAHIDEYLARENSQKWWRGLHFFASVAVSVGCLVAVWWSPRAFVSFLLVLLSTLGLATGTVDGLLSLLFFGSEIRWLHEFQWEIQNAKARATADGTAPDRKQLSALMDAKQTGPGTI